MRRMGRLFIPVLLSGVLGACGSGGGGDERDSAPYVAFGFDEGGGNGTVDSSANRLSGEISGGASWVDGKSGKALSFVNDGAQVYVPYSSRRLEGQEVSIALWLRPSEVNLAETSLIIGNSFSWMLELYQGKLRFTLNGGLGSLWDELITSPDVLSPDTWYHVAVTYDGSTAKLYVDGVEVASAAGIYHLSYDRDHRQIYIGGSQGCCQFRDYAHSFSGTIDDVFVGSRAMSPEQVQALFLDH